MSAPAPIEAAVLAVVGRPGMGWVAASVIARQPGRDRREVDVALAHLAATGELQRVVDWAAGQVTVLWRIARGSR